MTKTEIQLLAIHKAPVVSLADISERYLAMCPEAAAKLANVNRLPFPTFRLNQSRKAPLLVAISDLAAHIDTQAKCAQVSWRHSQV